MNNWHENRPCFGKNWLKHKKCPCFWQMQLCRTGMNKGREKGLFVSFIDACVSRIFSALVVLSCTKKTHHFLLTYAHVLKSLRQATLARQRRNQFKVNGSGDVGHPATGTQFNPPLSTRDKPVLLVKIVTRDPTTWNIFLFWAPVRNFSCPSQCSDSEWQSNKSEKFNFAQIRKFTKTTWRAEL